MHQITKLAPALSAARPDEECLTDAGLRMLILQKAVEFALLQASQILHSTETAYCTPGMAQEL